jgi:hypothetical protein
LRQVGADEEPSSDAGANIPDATMYCPILGP